MQQLISSASGYALCEPATPRLDTAQWLDFSIDPPHKGAAPATDVREQIARLTGLQIDELHIKDAHNALHPSYYDGTPSYDMVVFRGLVASAAIHTDPTHQVAGGQSDAAPSTTGSKTTYTIYLGSRKPVNGIKLKPILTEATTLFVSDRALVTVRHAAHANLQVVRACTARSNAQTSPHELMLRFLNQQVDAYLALRQPLTDLLDRWQRELLDPTKRFNDWTALLDARLELRKLESLSEEQYDALGELREAWSEPGALPYSAEVIASLRVRLSDVMEHIERVLNHARRLESSVESAIQLHFAAMSHQTNRMVTNLTLMTAVFAPLTLLTGFYGMNVPLPSQTAATAVWWIGGAMVLLTVGTIGLVIWMRRRARR